MPANRPSAAELLIAVREFLEQDIKASLAGGLRAADDSTEKSLTLNNAIAINLLKLLEREVDLRAAQHEEELTLLRELVSREPVLRELLFRNAMLREVPIDQSSIPEANVDVLNSAVIALIESEDFVDENKRVLHVLQQISLSKLAIDNPSYSTLRKHHH